MKAAPKGAAFFLSEFGFTGLKDCWIFVET